MYLIYCNKSRMFYYHINDHSFFTVAEKKESNSKLKVFYSTMFCDMVKENCLNICNIIWCKIKLETSKYSTTLYTVTKNKLLWKDYENLYNLRKYNMKTSELPMILKSDPLFFLKLHTTTYFRDFKKRLGNRSSFRCL